MNKLILLNLYITLQISKLYKRIVYSVVSLLNTQDINSPLVQDIRSLLHVKAELKL